MSSKPQYVCPGCNGAGRLAAHCAGKRCHWLRCACGVVWHPAGNRHFRNFDTPDNLRPRKDQP